MAGAATEAGVAALDCDDDDGDDVVKWVSNFVPALDGQDKRMYFYLFASWSEKKTSKWWREVIRLHWVEEKAYNSHMKVERKMQT